MSHQHERIDEWLKTITQRVRVQLRTRLRNSDQSQTELAEELNMDPSALSRLRSGRQERVGLKLLLRVCAGLDVDPAVVVGEQFSDSEEGAMDEIKRAARRFDQTEQESLHDLLIELSVLKGLDKDGDTSRTNNLLRAFQELTKGKASDIRGAAEKEQDFEESLDKAVRFEREWGSFGRLVEASIWAHRGLFWDAIAGKTFRKLDELSDEPFRFGRVARYFALRRRLAVFDPQGKGCFDDLESRIKEYRQSTGGHYTADRLLSKLYRHIGRYQQARQLAQEAFDELGERSNDDKPYLDRWEEVKCGRDLVAAYRKQLREEVVDAPGEISARAKAKRLCKQAENKLHAVRNTLKAFERYFSQRCPLERQRLNVEEGVIKRAKGILEDDHREKYFREGEDSLREAKELAEEESDLFGVMRSDAKLYDWHLSRGELRKATHVLMEILEAVAESMATPRLRKWIKSANSKYIKEDAGRQEKILTMLSEEIYDQVSCNCLDAPGSEGASC